MRSVALVSFVITASFEIYARVPEVCKTESGINGRCVPHRVCSRPLKYDQDKFCTSNSKICCEISVSEKIMTGDADPSSPPISPPTILSPTVLPIPANPIISSTETIIPTAAPNTPTPTATNANKDDESSLPLYQKKCDEYHTQHPSTSNGPKVLIIGGTMSASKEFPHMAAVGFGEENDKQWLCGGSLISESFVITAAHCISSSILGEARYVKLGTNNLQQSGEEFRILRRIPHPGFKSPSQYNDIALLELERPAKLSDYILPICLGNTADMSNENLIATGWGKTDFNGNSSPSLQKVDLEYFSNQACQVTYQKVSANQLSKGIDDATQICAGSKTAQKDTCQGDSGGPLQIKKNGKFQLIGITSFGIGCGTVNSPGVYTRVKEFIPWIESNVWK